MNITKELSETICKAIQLGQTLPYAGFFDEDESQIFNFVERKKLVQDIEKMLFGNQTFLEYIKDKFEQFSFSFGEKNYQTNIRFISNYKGFRFKKAEIYMFCNLNTDSHEYELVIPINQENSELYIQGLVALAEPTKMHGWLEFGFTAKNKATNRINKVHNKFSYSLQKGKNGDGVKDIEDIEYYNMAPIEDLAVEVFAKVNRNRPLNPKLNINDIELLRVWSVLHINIYSFNHVNVFKPNKIETLPEWENFEDFKLWSLNNGYKKGFALRRSGDTSLSIGTTSLVWMKDEKMIPDRYFWHYFNNQYYGHADPEISLTINGKTRTIREWSELTELSHHVIIGRLYSGMTDEKLIAPTLEKVNTFLNQIITIDGETRTAKEWAEFSGITPNTIASRIRYGWTGKDLIAPPRTKARITTNI